MVTALDRLAIKTRFTDSGCFEWQGYTVGKGYGRMMVDRVAWLVHRLAWTVQVGDIPEGMQLDHMCENKRCWNVAHLQVVTNQRNSALRGARRHQCKHGHDLTEATIYRYGGRRVCKQCQKRRAAEWYRRSNGLVPSSVRLHGSTA